MALVEDDSSEAAGRGLLLIRARDAERLVDGHLMQHERVIGDDEIGFACRPCGALDEAAAEMTAGGVDAFAATVGEAKRRRAHSAGFAVQSAIPEQSEQPGGEIAAYHVAIARVPRP